MPRKHLHSICKVSCWLPTGLVCGIVGCLVLFRSLLVAAPDQQWLWADNFDTRLLSWIFEWGYQILFVKRDPLNFFNAHSFYPHTNTLAYSDSALSAQLFYGPLRALGVGQLPALYFTLVSFSLLGCFLSDRALKKVSKGSLSPTERAIIIIAAHFSLSMTNFLSHYQLFGFQLAPAFFLYLYSWFTTFERSDLVLICSLFVIGICFSIYLAPMFLVLSLLVAIPLLLRALKTRGVRGVIKKIGYDSILIVLVFATLAYVIQLRPYAQLSEVFPAQSYDESAIYATSWKSVFRGFSVLSYWHSPGGYEKVGDWERAIFPGYLLLIGAVLSVILLALKLIGVRRARVQQQSDFADLPTDFLLYNALFLLCCLVLAMGPYWSLERKIALPYYYIGEMFSGLRSLRAPGRFGMFIGLPLGIFLVYLVRRLFQSTGKQKIAGLLVLLAVSVESWPSHPVYPVPYPDDGTYQQVKQFIKFGEPIVELPVVGSDFFDTLRRIMSQLNGSNVHGGKLVVGYGGKSTPENAEILDLDNKLHAGQGFDALLVFIKRLKMQYLLVRLNYYSPEAQQLFKGLITTAEAQVLIENKNLLLLRILKL